VVVATADPKTDVGAELLEEDIDLAVVAEGGVFAGAHAAEPWRVQAPRSRGVLQHDYRQTAWVGTVTLTGGTAGLAIERFTRHGPLALLPLLPLAAAADGTSRASIVWCVPTADDPVAPLSAEQRRAVLQTMFPAEAGTITSVSPLKSFALGLRAEPTLVEAGCIVRIGNAAQTLHPVAGQGLNLGLRDAHALCESLRRARREGGPGHGLTNALTRVQWERAPDRWAMIATTDFLARSFTWQAPGLASLRGLGLLAVEHLPGLKGLLARQMMFGRR
jgi:2-octaprenyl-6-methoxyphenol hydroxylase